MKKIIKVVKIKSCMECLYRFSSAKYSHNPTPSFNSWCEYDCYEKRTKVMSLTPILGKKAKRIRTKLDKIPSWCPLEDYEEGEK